MIQILRGHRQSAVRARAEVYAAVVLLQRDDPFLVLGAAPGVSGSAAGLSFAGPHHHPRLLGGYPRVLHSAPYLVQPYQLTHSRQTSAFVLERNLRGGACSVHPRSNLAGAGESEAGQVQRYEQRQHPGPDAIRSKDCDAHPLDAFHQLLRTRGSALSVVCNRSATPRRGHHEPGVGLVQHCDPGCRGRGGA